VTFAWLLELFLCIFLGIGKVIIVGLLYLASQVLLYLALLYGTIFFEERRKRKEQNGQIENYNK